MVLIAIVAPHIVRRSIVRTFGDLTCVPLPSPEVVNMNAFANPKGLRAVNEIPLHSIILVAIIAQNIVCSNITIVMNAFDIAGIKFAFALEANVHCIAWAQAFCPRINL
jgi:hypothetical protein